MKTVQLFAHLTKIDEAKREVWGVATAEVVDKDAEMMDYATSKPYFEEWSKEFSSATAGKSLGNVREMHQASAVGKLIDISFDDQSKAITVGAKIVDEGAWVKCAEGVYTGFSIGGRYMKVWPDEMPDGQEIYRFTAQPVEISVVDNPCCPVSHFTAVKADGSTEVRKFAEKTAAAAALPVVQKDADGDDDDAKAECMKALNASYSEMGKCLGKDCGHGGLELCMEMMGKCHKSMGDAIAGLADDKQLPQSKTVSADQPPDAVPGEQMKPEQEQQLVKAAADGASALAKVEAIEKQQGELKTSVGSIESGMKELAVAFKAFVEGFAKSLEPERKTVARTQVVSKEDDKNGGVVKTDKEETVFDALKVAHQNPQPGTGVNHVR